MSESQRLQASQGRVERLMHRHSLILRLPTNQIPQEKRLIMSKFKSFIRRLLRRDIYINACALGVTDDVVVQVKDSPATVDVVALSGALQKQFPGRVIHLLVGFDGVEVISQENNKNGSCAANQGRRNPSKSREEAAQLFKVAPELTQQGYVLLLRVCLGNRVIAVSAPVSPNGQSNSVIEPAQRVTSG